MSDAQYSYTIEAGTGSSWVLKFFENDKEVGGGVFFAGQFEDGEKTLDDAYEEALEEAQSWLEFKAAFYEEELTGGGFEELDRAPIADGKTLSVCRIGSGYKQCFWRICNGKSVLFDSLLAGVSCGPLFSVMEQCIAFLVSGFFEELVNDGDVNITADDLKMIVDDFRVTYGDTSPFFEPPPSLTGGE